MAAPKLPVPLPSRTERLSEIWLAEARSRMPSPLKSAEVTETGPSPAAKLVAAPKLPVPVPSRTERLPEPKLAEARSWMPSPLKSAEVTELGPVAWRRSVTVGRAEASGAVSEQDREVVGVEVGRSEVLDAVTVEVGRGD